jgi:hypothetical protein
MKPKINSKIIIPLTFVAVILSLTVGCVKEPLLPSGLRTTDITTPSGQSVQIEVDPRIKNITFRISPGQGQEFRGSVSSTGLFTGRILGNNWVQVYSGNAYLGECYVLVTERYDQRFKPPFFTDTIQNGGFDLYRSSILTYENNAGRRLIDESASAMIFEGENSRVINVAYLYDPYINILDYLLLCAVIEIPNSELSHIRDYLAQKNYELADDIFLNLPGTTMIGVRPSQRDSWLVIYAEGFLRPYSISEAFDLLAIQMFLTVYHQRLDSIANLYHDAIGEN